MNPCLKHGQREHDLSRYDLERSQEMGEKEREIRGLRDRILEGRWSEDTDIAGGDGVLVEN